MTEQNFLSTSEKKSYDVVNNKVDPNWFRGCISAKL